MIQNVHEPFLCVRRYQNGGCDRYGMDPEYIQDPIQKGSGRVYFDAILSASPIE